MRPLAALPFSANGFTLGQPPICEGNAASDAHADGKGENGGKNFAEDEAKQN